MQALKNWRRKTDTKILDHKSFTSIVIIIKKCQFRKHLKPSWNCFVSCKNFHFVHFVWYWKWHKVKSWRWYEGRKKFYYVSKSLFNTMMINLLKTIVLKVFINISRKLFSFFNFFVAVHKRRRSIFNGRISENYI